MPCAATGGSSSAATAAPGPSTWPACPRRSGTFPGEPGTLATQAAPACLHGLFYPADPDPGQEAAQKPLRSVAGREDFVHITGQ